MPHSSDPDFFCDFEELGFCALVLWLDPDGMRISLLYSRDPVCFPVKVGNIYNIPHNQGMERPALIIAAETTTFQTMSVGRKVLRNQADRDTDDEVFIRAEIRHDSACLGCPLACPLFEEVELQFEWGDEDSYFPEH